MTKADLTDPARAAQRGERAAAAGDGRPVLGAHRRRRRGRARRPRRGRRRACPARDASAGEPLLHVDRAFTIRGAGTVVTGTLWSGAVAPGDRLVLLPAGTPVRVRSVQIHDEPVERADAGQRVALNLVGVERREVARGDVVAAPGAVAPSRVLDCELDPARRAATGCARTSTTARARRRRAWPTSAAGCGRRASSSRCWRAPAIASSCARSRRPTPWAAASCSTPPRAATAGAPTRSRAWSACAAASPSPSRRRRRPPPPRRRPRRAPLADSALALEERLRAAGHEPPNAADLDADDLAALRAAGRAVRVGRAMYAHPEALAAVRATGRGGHRRRRRDHPGPPARRAADLAQVRPGAARAPRRRAGDQAPARRLARAAPQRKESRCTADHRAVRAFSRLGAALPKGRTLPPAVWRRRHAWMLRLLWAHVVGLFAWGLLAGNPLWHAVVDAGPVLVCAAVAIARALLAAQPRGRRVRRAAHLLGRRRAPHARSPSRATSTSS